MLVRVWGTKYCPLLLMGVYTGVAILEENVLSTNADTL